MRDEDEEVGFLRDEAASSKGRRQQPAMSENQTKKNCIATEIERNTPPLYPSATKQFEAAATCCDVGVMKVFGEERYSIVYPARKNICQNDGTNGGAYIISDCAIKVNTQHKSSENEANLYNQITDEAP